MTDTDFAQLVTRVLGSSTPRVWSLLVTMFGDLALAPQARLSGATVNAITAAIGIKPEATRVALHRLRKEDWIESHRSGRQSRYELTNMGRAETKAAWPRVYGPAPSDVTAYLVLNDPSSQSDMPSDRNTGASVQIGPKAMVTVDVPPKDHQLALAIGATDHVPQWVSDKLCPPEVQTASRDLALRLTHLSESGELDQMTLLQRTALRVVVVHEWRRLILRVPALPEHLFSDAWHGAACRTLFLDLLSRLPAPDMASLEQEIDCD